MSKFSLLSKKNKSLLTDPLDDNNPVTVQVLGICSALANYCSAKASSCNGNFCFICNVCC